mmetsp:Transcript_22679/g.52891  ORF Transcript_22679/g.52891 Transcript_22679/m.52891 type:complete len:112 (-) Transcript_22679:465-800(-)
MTCTNYDHDRRVMDRYFSDRCYKIQIPFCEERTKKGWKVRLALFDCSKQNVALFHALKGLCQLFRTRHSDRSPQNISNKFELLPTCQTPPHPSNGDFHVAVTQYYLDLLWQ